MRKVDNPVDALGAIGVGLNINMTDRLPHHWFEDLDQVPKLIQAVLIRYQAFGNRLHAIGPDDVKNHGWSTGSKRKVRSEF